MRDSASSFSNSGDEYIPRAINTLCILCAWLGTSGRQLARGRVQSLLQEDSFCLCSSQMQNGIQPWPYWYQAQLPWRLFQASMPQASLQCEVKVERQEKPYKRVAKQQTLSNGTRCMRNGNLRKESSCVFKNFFSRCMPLEGKYILPNIIRQIWMIPASLNEFLLHTEYNNSLGPPPSHTIHQSCKLFKICVSWRILFWGKHV